MALNEIEARRRDLSLKLPWMERVERVERFFDKLRLRRPPNEEWLEVTDRERDDVEGIDVEVEGEE